MSEAEKPRRGGKRPGAGRKPKVEQTEEIKALVEALRPVKVGRGNYSRTDRFRDFSTVFHGSEQGKRVLAQIIDLCEGPVTTEADLSNHALLAGRAMSRRVGGLIAAWASVPPAEDVGASEPTTKEAL